MIKLRKLFAACLSLLLMFSLVPAVSLAAGNDVFALKADRITLEVGDTLQVSIEGRQLTDLYASEFFVDYNAEKLKLDFKKSHSEIGAFEVPLSVSGDTIRVTQTLIGNKEGIKGNASLYTLTFEAKAAGTAEFSFTEIIMIDSELNSTSGLTEGSISVTINEDSDTNPGPDDPGPGPGEPSDPGPSDPGPGPQVPLPPVVTPDSEAGENGTVTADVDPATLKGAIDEAEGKTVRVEVKPSEGAKQVLVRISVEQILYADEKKIDTIEIDTGLATVSIHPKLLKGSTASKLELTVAAVDPSALPEDVREALGSDTVVYDFNLSVDGSKISNFRGNEVQVGIPYTLKPGDNPNKIVIYYLTDDGKLEVVKNGKYNAATGKVEFKPKHFSIYAAAYVNVGFDDIGHVEWAKDAIEGLAARTIVQGVGDGQFLPDGKVTRAEFITMLMNAFDLVNPDAATTLKDVLAGEWYYSAIASAQQSGIVEGKTEDTFGVQDTITRQDMAVMIHRTAQKLNLQLEAKGNTTSFADRESISNYAADAVEAMRQTGIIEGIGEGIFAPHDQATRAQAAVIMYRLLQ